MPKKKCKTKVFSKDIDNVSDKVKFYTNPVTVKQRMENARSMDLFNANYEDDIFDHLNNNVSKGKKVDYFNLSSSSVDTVEEKGSSSEKSFSSPYVLPPLQSSASNSQTPGKYKNHDKELVSSPIRR